MKLTKLKTQEQFDRLKKGDIIIVHWESGSTEFKKGNMLAHYSMVEINRSNEIILRKKDNIYFNIPMYLKGKSIAKVACIVESKSLAEGHPSTE